ncbi:MAG: YeeE/YedE family protein [Hyphomicrobiaceae bacterium]
MTFDYGIVGGFLCGALAGGGARYGRLCSMSAIEDALVGHDYRGAKAWGFAVGVAGLATLPLAAAGYADIEASALLQPRVHLLGIVVGGLMFGLGMTLVGTCSFGLVVRAGSGDLRALVSAILVGVFAFAVTSGLLAPVRLWLLGFGNVDLSPLGVASLDALLASVIGKAGATAASVAGFVALTLLALSDRRLRARPRLMIAAVMLGLAVAAGWAVTTISVRELASSRIASLSFVTPFGRVLLQLMTVAFREIGFGTSALLGVLLASFAVAAVRRELRWEAFDDPLEMRRHMTGAALMGIGGVLAHGCTVGQGLTAASALALTAPVFVIAVLAGAQLGLKLLIEGTALWRLGFSPRAD